MWHCFDVFTRNRKTRNQENCLALQTEVLIWCIWSSFDFRVSKKTDFGHSKNWPSKFLGIQSSSFDLWALAIQHLGVSCWSHIYQVSPEFSGWMAIGQNSGALLFSLSWYLRMFTPKCCSSSYFNIFHRFQMVPNGSKSASQISSKEVLIICRLRCLDEKIRRMTATKFTPENHWDIMIYH